MSASLKLVDVLRKVEILVEEAHLQMVATPVGAITDVQRLVQIADNVDDEVQCDLFVRTARCWVSKRIGEPLQSSEGIAIVVAQDVSSHLFTAVACTAISDTQAVGTPC